MSVEAVREALEANKWKPKKHEIIFLTTVFYGLAVGTLAGLIALFTYGYIIMGVTFSILSILCWGLAIASNVYYYESLPPKTYYL